MKLGFSTVACPDWSLDTIVAQAAAMGFNGVELCGLQGQMHLPVSPVLVANARQVAEQFHAAGVELVCLGTGHRLGWPDKRRLAAEKGQVRELLELAGELGCPFIRVFGDGAAPSEDHDAFLMRVADALRELAPFATACHTAILLENRGRLTGSRDIWFVLDAVNHPAVRCCWNPWPARVAGEDMGLSVPRLGTRIALTHLLDGRLAGGAATYTLPGDGDLDLPRYLEILQGIAYQGYLMLEWPPPSVSAPAGPETLLPAALSRVKTMLEALAQAPELSAYKGDKKAVKYASPTAQR